MVKLLLHLYVMIDAPMTLTNLIQWKLRANSIPGDKSLSIIIVQLLWTSHMSKDTRRKDVEGKKCLLVANSQFTTFPIKTNAFLNLFESN